jgi:hypothetical protein
MRVAGIDDVRVDLVGHHHQIMLDREVRNLLQPGAPFGQIARSGRIRLCIFGTNGG